MIRNMGSYLHKSAIVGKGKWNHTKLQGRCSKTEKRKLLFTLHIIKLYNSTPH